MDIRFDYKGIPNGGCILNYLLEKSRVICQAKNERNFHVFYQLLNGADDEMIDRLKLSRNTSKYEYLNKNYTNWELDENSNFNEMLQALDVCEFSDQDKDVTTFYKLI